jgi:site-specific DNA-methyltransferase (adenine-specific)
MPGNLLYYGDNLDILRNKIRDETVDLCYADPPFNSKRNYFQIYNRIGKENHAQAQAFVDTWRWEDHARDGYEEIVTNVQGRFTRQTIELIKGLHSVLGEDSLLAYLVSMTLRINEIQRVLKPTGSFYLHCDPTASHYLKLVLDAVFCARGGDFINEIVWCYKSRPQSKHHFGKKHDTLLFYTASETYTFNWQAVVRPLVEATTEKYKLMDANGRRYRLQGRGITGSPIRSAKDVDPKWEETRPELVVRDYLDEKVGVALEDWWVDINILNQVAAERLGYPTQKPEALLKRIIIASSNPEDVVLDPYCGCGTTVIAAERNNRRWIGIDITYQSIALILQRLEETFTPEVLKSVTLDGIPQDMDSAIALAHKKDDRVRKEFEKWAVLTYSNNRAAINLKKQADQGVDGIAYFLPKYNADPERIVFQVKSGSVNRGDIAKLDHDRQREQAQIGVLITLEDPSKPMLQEARTAGTYFYEQLQKKFDRIQIVKVQDMIEKGARCEIPLNYRLTKSAMASQEGMEQLTLGESTGE